MSAYAAILGSEPAPLTTSPSCPSEIYRLLSVIRSATQYPQSEKYMIKTAFIHDFKKGGRCAERYENRPKLLPALRHTVETPLKRP